MNLLANTPLVSFYMTVRNGFPYIAHSIESLKRQTYGNWEAVIVDDGSADSTPEYLESITAEDERFRLIAAGGVGRGRALNIALANVRGRFVANLDADDLAHPVRAELQVRTLTRAGAPFVCGEMRVIYDGEDVMWEGLGPDLEVPVVDISDRLVMHNPVNHSTVMMDRALLARIGGYDENRVAQLDYELWFRLAKHGVRLHEMQCCLGAKRIHASQSFENKNRLKYLWSSFLLQNRIIAEFEADRRYRAYALGRLAYGVLPQRLRVSRR